jgi:hypothetical protein
MSAKMSVEGSPGAIGVPLGLGLGKEGASSNGPLAAENRTIARMTDVISMADDPCLEPSIRSTSAFYSEIAGMLPCQL